MRRLFVFSPLSFPSYPIIHFISSVFLILFLSNILQLKRRKRRTKRSTHWFQFQRAFVSDNGRNRDAQTSQISGWKLKRSAEKQPLNACHVPFQLISNDVLIGNRTRPFVSFNTELEYKYEVRHIVALSILTDAMDLRSKLFVKSASPVFCLSSHFRGRRD